MIKTAMPWITATVVAATTLFVIVWHADRSLWNDEVWIIDAATKPTYGQTLTHAIEVRLTASPGYLAVSRVLVGWSQDRPWIFRLPSAVFGTGLLAIMGILLGRLAGNRSLGWVAVLIVLACPLFQRYLTEAKQYMTAAALTVALIACADWWVGSRRLAAGITWLIVALMAVAMSFSAWFAVAGTGLVVWVAWWVKKDRTRLLQATGCGVLIAGLAATIYLGFSRPIASRQSQEFATYWGNTYLPLDVSWPIQVWRLGNEMLAKAWYLYSVPTWAMLLLAGAGWVVWFKRRPIAAIAVLATAGITAVASTLHLWPLEARINISLLTLIHLSLLAGPLGLLGWIVSKRSGIAASHDTSAEDDVGDQASIKPMLVEVSVLLVAVVLAIGVTIESSGVNYEVAAVDQLLDEVADRSGENDLVLLGWTASVNQRLLSRPIQGTIQLAPWPDPNKVVTQTQQLIDDWSGRYVYIAVGHHNKELAVGWDALGDALSQQGQFEKVWAGKMAALYRFEPSKP